MHVVIAGCGRVGAQLAESLSYENHDVVVIDKEPEAFRRLGGTFHGLCIDGIAFDEDTLLDAGIKVARTFVAVTNADKSNLMAGLVAKRLFNVPTVLSRLYNPAIERTFSDLGVDHVCGTELVADEIMELLFRNDEFRVLHKYKDLGLRVVELLVPAEASGMLASEFSNGVTLKFIVLAHDNREITVNADTRLASGDSMVIVSLEDGWMTACKLLGITPRTQTQVQNKKPEDAKIVIGGCSQVGAQLAARLSTKGFKVTVIDNNPEKSRRLRGIHSIDFIEGLTYEEHTLSEAGIEEAAAFTAVGKLDNENLMAAEVAKHAFRVPRVVARLFNPDKESTYRALDTTYVCGTRILSRAILGEILQPSVRVKSSRALLDHDLVELESPKKWVGKTLGSLASKTGIIFTYIIRGKSCGLPDNDLVLGDHDIIGALATPKMSLKLEKYMSGTRKWLPSN